MPCTARSIACLLLLALGGLTAWMGVERERDHDSGRIDGVTRTYSYEPVTSGIMCLSAVPALPDCSAVVPPAETECILPEHASCAGTRVGNRTWNYYVGLVALYPHSARYNYEVVSTVCGPRNTTECITRWTRDHMGTVIHYRGRVTFYYGIGYVLGFLFTCLLAACIIMQAIVKRMPCYYEDTPRHAYANFDNYGGTMDSP